jgi:methylated-DNA-[protein]-cysteine S-methyltransferase
MSMQEVYIQSPLGPIYIAASGEQINEVSFVNSLKGKKADEENLDLCMPASDVLTKCVAQLQEYFNGQRTEFELPLSQSGTDFQKRVWDELVSIPYNKTISYLQLSKQLGNTKAIRAVGAANGCNKINIIIPCHRVIGSNGSLIGYGGNLWRKQWLLLHEQKVSGTALSLFPSL